MRHMPEVASANCSYNGRGNPLLNTYQPKLTKGAQACAAGCGSRGRERKADRGKHVSSCHHRTSRPHPMEETVSYYHQNRSRSDETNGSARSEGGQERWLTTSYVDITPVTMHIVSH